MEISISEDVIKVIIKELEKRGYKVTKPKEDDKWPKEGDQFFYICVDGQIQDTKYRHVDWIDQIIAIGNAFRTYKDAEFEVERLKVIKILKQYEDKDQVWDGNERHYYIRYALPCEEIDVAYHTEFKNSGTIYFRSILDAMTAIEIVGEERIKKYYLGVVR